MKLFKVDPCAVERFSRDDPLRGFRRGKSLFLASVHIASIKCIQSFLFEESEIQFGFKYGE